MTTRRSLLLGAAGAVTVSGLAGAPDAAFAQGAVIDITRARTNPIPIAIPDFAGAGDGILLNLREKTGELRVVAVQELFLLEPVRKDYLSPWRYAEAVADRVPSPVRSFVLRASNRRQTRREKNG